MGTESSLYSPEKLQNREVVWMQYDKEWRSSDGRVDEAPVG